MEQYYEIPLGWVRFDPTPATTAATVHQKYTLSDGSFRGIKYNTVPWNLFFFNKRSGEMVMPLDSEGLGAAGEGSNLT